MLPPLFLRRSKTSPLTEEYGERACCGFKPGENPNGSGQPAGSD
jgi:hypothetical protein